MCAFLFCFQIKLVIMMTIYKQLLRFSYVLNIHICLAKSESDLGEHKEIGIKLVYFLLYGARGKSIHIQLP